jgi:hypothetical protein
MESTQFTKNLIEKTIQCFKEEHGFELSPEKANEYLNSLASLYLAFSNGINEPPAVGGKRPTPEACLPDLLTHSLNKK